MTRARGFRLLRSVALAGVLLAGSTLAAAAAESPEADGLVPVPPDSGPGWVAYERGIELAAGGEKAGALAALEESIRLEPANMRYSNEYRMVAGRLGEHDRAIKFFEGMAGEPNPPIEAYYNLGFAYIDKIPLLGEMGRGFQSKKSLKQFEKALAREPESWVATFGTAMNYLHWPAFFGKQKLAIEGFRKCLALQAGKAPRPYFVLPYLRLGDAYVRNDQVEEAQKVWEEGLALFPGHPELAERLSQGPKIKDYINGLLGLHTIKTIDTNLAILWKK